MSEGISFQPDPKHVARLVGIRIKPLPKSLKRRRKIQRHRHREFFKMPDFKIVGIETRVDPDTQIPFIITSLDDGREIVSMAMGFGTNPFPNWDGTILASPSPFITHDWPLNAK